MAQLLAFCFKGKQKYMSPQITHQHGSLLEGLGKPVCLRTEGKHYSVSGRKGLWVSHHFLLPTPQGQKISSTYNLKD